MHGFNEALHRKRWIVKMTLKQFVPWLRGTNGGRDFAQPLLEELYTHVADSEIQTGGRTRR